MNNFNKFTLTTAFVLSALIPGKAFAATLISDEVVGSSTPEVTFGTSLQNGDFTLTPNNSKILGDGKDEITKWNFNFGVDSIKSTITKALVNLDVTPFIYSKNDDFWITGIGSVKANKFLDFNSVEYGKQQSVEINLFDFFSADKIATAFNNGQGNLEAGYSDDAIVSFAKMTLEFQPASVPEPTTTLGLLALVGLGSPLLKKRKS